MMARCVKPQSALCATVQSIVRRPVSGLIGSTAFWRDERLAFFGHVVVVMLCEQHVGVGIREGNTEFRVGGGGFGHALWETVSIRQAGAITLLPSFGSARIGVGGCATRAVVALGRFRRGILAIVIFGLWACAFGVYRRCFLISRARYAASEYAKTGTCNDQFAFHGDLHCQFLLDGLGFQNNPKKDRTFPICACGSPRRWRWDRPR